MRGFRAGVAVLICLLFSGCLGLVPSPFRPSPGPQKTPQPEDLAQAFEVVCRNFRLGPDDVLRIVYQTEWTVPSGSFVLDTLDEIDVEFILDPQLNRRAIIRPDGMITLSGVGDIKAAGLTPEQLAKRISEVYQETGIFSKEETRAELRNYKLVTVHVINFYQKVKKLVESLTTLVGGQQTQIIVGPDGTIDLPLLKERILAAGHTIREVEQTINQRYREGPLKQVIASLSLYEAKSRKIYVMGEVEKPGAYDIKQPVTALHAISMAGGHISQTADLTSVILISKDIEGKPIGRRLDLKRILDVGDMSPAILVKPYDVIFVPRTYVSDLRLFMDQYFKTVTEFTEFVDLLKQRQKGQ